MNEFISYVQSPAFWLGVLVVGVLVNLIAAYLKPHIDKSLSSVSARWAKKVEELERKRMARIKTLRGDKHKQLVASRRQVEHLIESVHSLALAAIMMLAGIGLKVFDPESWSTAIGGVVTMLGAVIGLQLGMQSKRKADRLGEELSEAENDSNTLSQ